MGPKLRQKAAKPDLFRMESVTYGRFGTDGLRACNWLKGGEDDAIHAVLRGAGNHLRLNLENLRVLLSTQFAMLLLQRHGKAASAGSLNTAV